LFGLSIEDHRRTNQGAGGRGAAVPLTRAKPLFFGQKLNFSARSQQPKMKNKYFLYILNEKTEFIPSSKIKCPKSGIFTNNNWVGESGKVILQVSIAVFSDRVAKIFRAKMAQPS